MLSGFWSSAPDLTPPTRMVTFSCGCLFGVGVLVVNCIVDASIFDLCKQYWLTDCWLVLFLLLVFKSVRWMPWYQGPMKDVVDCDKPRGAV